MFYCLSEALHYDYTTGVLTFATNCLAVFRNPAYKVLYCEKSFALYQAILVYKWNEKELNLNNHQATPKSIQHTLSKFNEKLIHGWQCVAE